MIIANFTPDAILWMHGGQDGTLKPGDIKEFPDARARHILNKFDRRGILVLNFGDDPDKKRDEAMKIWRNFWVRQVTVFNQDNERRKNTNREYLDPHEELREHAEKLGLELVGPWSLKVTDNAQIMGVLQENATLKVQLAQLTAQVAELAGAMKSRNIPFELKTTQEKIETSKPVGDESQPDELNPPVNLAPKEVKAAEPEIDSSVFIKEFSKLSADRFGEWVMTNLDRIQSPDYPASIRSMVKEKWERLIKGEFPLPE
jgi:hypothetical protein